MNQVTLSPESRNAHFGVATAIALFIGGMVLGLFGGFLQAVTWHLGSVALPFGLVLVLATLVSVLRALIHAFDRRRAGVSFLLGWGTASVLLALPWPGGDIVIARSGLALVYLLGGVILGSAVCNVPARLRPAPAPIPPVGEDA